MTAIKTYWYRPGKRRQTRIMHATKVIVTFHDVAPIDFGNSPSESRFPNNEDVIVKVVKSAVMDLVGNKLLALIEESMDDVLQKLLQNAQWGIRLVVCNVVEQVMLDLLHEEVIGNMLDSLIAKCFDNNATADRLSQKLLTSNTFNAPIATFVRREANTAMEHK